MNNYVYRGPVVIFGQCVQSNWIAGTSAVSEKKARSNLEYRWKKEHGRTPGAKISLPGKIEIIS